MMIFTRRIESAWFAAAEWTARSIMLTTGLLLSFFLLLALPQPAVASIAYGTLNNFDCVNDTGVEAHGFDIELTDIRSKDITYTYDYNHYGIPKITEDLTDPMHPKVLVRYAAVRNANGTWSAYTAVPSGPIAPTMGHQFTNPAVNFGGEHFGVGYYGAPTAVKYNWLIDDGTGKLVHGPPVMVSTPTFTYNPPVGPAPANVVAVVVPPPPPAPPVYQFGDASWVKEIKTTTHNPGKVELRDLVGDDPGKPQPWANGEPAEVEVEWRILQTEFAGANGGKNGELKGAPEDLPGGDEVITRRYEFYKYIGPIDAETGEAVADTVASDGLHGVGSVTYADHFDPNTGEWVTITVDLSKVIIVGDFFGAQMSGFDVAPKLGLIDHIQDGEKNVAYADRTVVIGGGSPFLASVKSGSLPDGLSLGQVTGVLTGTPTSAGTFTFTIQAEDTSGALVTRDYTVTITGDAAPVTYLITTGASPAEGGNVSGGGNYNSGDSVTVNAVANPGYAFVNWTEHGMVFSDQASYTFIAAANRELVANFVPTYLIMTSASPSAGGTTSGGGLFNSGSSLTVHAVANAGYAFLNWTEGGAVVSSNADYTFTANSNRVLTANFRDNTPPTTSSSLSGPMGGAGWYTGAVTVTLSATDPDGAADVAATYYTIDGGAQHTYAAPFQVSGNGSHSVTFWSVDQSGNVEAVHSQTINIDRMPPVITATATPNVLSPPNGRMVLVTLSGRITDSLSGVNTAGGTYATTDLYGQVQPSGSFPIAPDGSFSFTVMLEARRNGQDKFGRIYKINIRALDQAGNSATLPVMVTVPHN